jgi:WD40 repeat protein
VSVVAEPVVEGPFKGLTPFEDSDLDAVLFFGREREREVIAANLLASRLTVLYGASGVGKSSVLRAGVVHHLRTMARRNLETRGHPEFAVVVFDAWTQDPMAGLLDAVEAELREVFGPELAPHDRGDTPAETLDDWTARLDCDLLLVLDQTEEYFLYHEEEEGPGTFAGELPELVTKPGLRVSVLLAIRDDALARLDRFKGRIPNLFANYLRLDHLDRRAGRAAILGPIEQYNAIAQPASRAAIEPELVEALLDETTAGRVSLGQRGRGVVRRGGVRTRVEAPYLQLVLYRLWEEERAAGSSVLRLETLERLGGANEVVRTHLERALAELPSEDKDVAADVFSHLVTPSGTKIAHGLHDLAEYAHVREDRLEPIVSRLVHQRILRPVAKGANGTTNGAIEAPPYEIFHDVLGEAVLDWRTRHESERRVAHERAESDRRHRRVLAVLVAVLVALAAMTAIAAYAVAKRSEAREQAAKATDAAALAEQRRLEAKRQEQNAVNESKRATAARNDAVRERNRARRAEDEAEVQRASAEVQRQAAVRGREDANAQRLFALEQKATAEEQTRVAQSAKRDADRQRRRAVRERATAVAQKQRAQARLLLAEAREALTVDPRITLEKALRAVRLVPLAESEKVFRDGLIELRVESIAHGGGPLITATFSQDGGLFATAAAPARGAAEARIFRTTPLRLLQRLRHDSSVSSVAFSPGGRRLATGEDDGDVRIWDTASGAPGPLLAHGGRVRSVEFSPDGRVLATASDDSSVRVWDVASGVLLHRFGMPGPTRSAHFSSDGRLLVTAPFDNEPAAYVVDVESGERVKALVHPGAVTSAQFTPDGTKVVSSGRRNIFIWARPTWRQLHVLSGHASPVHGVNVSSNSQRAVSFDDAGLARVWRLDTGAMVTMLIRHENSIDSAVFAPDDATVLTASKDLTARIWTGPLSEFRTSLVGHRGALRTAVYHPSGGLVLTASADGTARLWRPSTEPTLALLGEQRHTGGALALDVRRDARFAASGGADGAVRLWRPSGGLVRTLELGGRVKTVAFSNDGRLLLGVSDNGLGRLWRVPGGEAVATVNHGAPIAAGALNPDGRTIVTVGGETVRAWTAVGIPRWTGRHGDDVTSVAFSPEGRHVLTGSADRTARFWDVSTGSEIRTLRGHNGAVTAVAFSRNGRWMATASADATARVWSSPSATAAARELGPHLDALTSVRFSFDGTRVVTASADGEVSSWPITGRREPVSYRGHVSIVADARFSPDGRWVVTAGPSAAGLFVAETGERVYFLRGHGAPLSAAIFTRDSRRIVTAGTDGSVRTYVCNVCGSLAQLRREAKRRLGQIVTVRVRGD